ncbi:2-alkenal (NADP(+)-dependent) [Cyphellophora attinorum]|uniref:2-alkenal (NADP(+)-dependent) n=1 Tax=Cyphellophora attinorum TaxID=1664694 RepID=A0A0N1H2N0_9EURO|nr:2-alkenal (NADP(+)-dependent) [Phialophora attinorum]KPI34417.1 2-alkenal (NADP(+)-dependent) [Phialophora attinorum]
MAPTTTKQWKLRQKPHGMPVLEGSEQTFELTTTTLNEPQDGEVLVQTVYLSNDPAQRSWISPSVDPDRAYLPPLQPGDTMRALGIGSVIESRDDKLEVGSLVVGRMGWSEYSVHPAQNLVMLDPPEGLRETHFLGGLGLPGLTAYYALKEIVELKKTDTIVVSAAAGAVGSMVVQIAKKVLGCGRVSSISYSHAPDAHDSDADFLQLIGIAGTEEKCRWVESLGADKCLNYKDSHFAENLAAETEDFADVYFACGMTSTYNDVVNQTGIKNLFEVVTMRLKMLGFINIDYLDHQKEVTDLLVREWSAGNLVLRDDNETIVDTVFEDIPKTWALLFTGGNTGKLLTRLVEANNT